MRRSLLVGIATATLCVVGLVACQQAEETSPGPVEVPQSTFHVHCTAADDFDAIFFDSSTNEAARIEPAAVRFRLPNGNIRGIVSGTSCTYEYTPLTAQ